MPFKFSRCICLQTPRFESAVNFYKDVLGLDPVEEGEGSAELRAGSNRLLIDEGARMGPILEFLVPDLDAAKEELLAKGCQVVVWEGKGGRCYLRDSFDFFFNLYEDPPAFEG